MATGYELKWLDPEDYELIAPYFREEQSPMPNPQFSRVLASLTPEGQLAGFVVLQLVAHAEPIWVDPKHRGNKIASQLTEGMDGYLRGLNLPGVYTQPSNPTAEALCRKAGLEPAPFPLWVKVYDDVYKSLIPEEEIK